MTTHAEELCNGLRKIVADAAYAEEDGSIHVYDESRYLTEAAFLIESLVTALRGLLEPQNEYCIALLRGKVQVIYSCEAWDAAFSALALAAKATK